MVNLTLASHLSMTKLTSNVSRKVGRSCWNELTARDCDHALHWHRIYLDH